MNNLFYAIIGTAAGWFAFSFIEWHWVNAELLSSLGRDKRGALLVIWLLIVYASVLIGSRTDGNVTIVDLSDDEKSE